MALRSIPTVSSLLVLLSACSSSGGGEGGSSETGAGGPGSFGGESSATATEDDDWRAFCLRPRTVVQSSPFMLPTTTALSARRKKGRGTAHFLASFAAFVE